MIIKKFDSKKASGIDNTRSKLLKACGSELSKGLDHSANLSFANGNYPDQLKIANVIALIKILNITVQKGTDLSACYALLIK